MTPLHYLIRVATFTFIACPLIACYAQEADIVTTVAVKTDTIRVTNLKRYVQAYGLVEPQPANHSNPAASAKIAAPVAGLMSQIYCEEGQTVKKGERLFSLDSRAVDDQIAKAHVALNFAEKNFERKQKLNPGESISRKLYDDALQMLETARADLHSAQTQADLLVITAPLSGRVSAVHFKTGEAITPSNVLAEVIDLHRIDVALHVPSHEMQDLQVGQTVAINVSSSNNTIAGTLTFISPQIDPLTDTILVRATPLQNNCPQTPCLVPGQFTHARIVVEERKNCLAVPIASVVMSNPQPTIAIVDGDHAKQQAVSVGLRDGDLIEISGKNLRSGMIVVSEGSYGLPPETRVQVLK